MVAAGAGGPAEDSALRVDLKTTLANERTILRWLRSAVMVGSLATFLLSFQDVQTQVNGILMSLVAISFAFWPLRGFWDRSRAYALASLAKQPKVDQMLPRVLSASLGGILSAVLLVDWAFGTPA